MNDRVQARYASPTERPTGNMTLTPLSTTEQASVAQNSHEKKDRWASGVTPYAEMGHYDADYEPKDTDILCAFQ
ncbi:MAG: hypothetical protein WBP81_28855 [Solirubrobacteraceae bacterium]